MTIDEIIGDKQLLIGLRRAALIQSAKKDFWGFCRYMDDSFFMKRRFLEDVAHAFQWIIDEYRAGRPRRASVSMPPRAGKSYITSLFCAYFIGQFPELAVMRNSATYRLYKKFSKDVKKILNSDQFKLAYPEIVINRTDSAVEGWSVSQAKQKSYFGHGVGGQIIGFGANIAISDDLYPNLEKALSDNYHEKVFGWKESDHDSRKELNCPEIYIGTRWSIRDVIGDAINKGRVDRIVTIPAMVVNERGELVSFCENVKTTSEYNMIREDTDEVIWAAEYMQQPIEAEGLLFPESGMKWYDPEDIDISKYAEYRLSFYDPNAEGDDYFAGLVGYKIDSLIYVAPKGWLFNRFLSEENMAAVTSQTLHHKVDYLQIETIGAFIHFGKMVRDAVEEVKPDMEVKLLRGETNKHAKILANAGVIRNRFVWPRSMKHDKEGREFLKNLNSYSRAGDNKHDDAPDVCATAARWARKEFEWA